MGTYPNAEAPTSLATPLGQHHSADTDASRGFRGFRSERTNEVSTNRSLQIYHVWARIVFPGHALHEKGLQRQKSAGPLVSSQEERALLVPLINRGSTGDEPRVNRGFCFPIGLHRISLVRASGETFKRRVFDALEGTRKDGPLGEQFCWHTVLSDPVPPPRRAFRRDTPVVCPVFGLSN